MNLNCTDVNGTLVRVVYVTQGADQATAADDSKTDDDYDQTGAMHFIVATVLVYSILGVFCTLINRIRRLGGRGNQNNMHDESIQKYLKNEKMLKLDGGKVKLVYECELIAQRVKEYEEKQQLLQLENELTSDFSKEKYSEGRQKRRSRKKKRDIGSTLGKMGASLFYFGTDPDLMVNNNKQPDDGDVNSDDKHEDVCMSDDWKPGVAFTIDLMNQASDTEHDGIDNSDA